MQANEALILWNRIDAIAVFQDMAGQCRVVRHGQEDDRRFAYSGGAAHAHRQGLKGDAQLVALLLDYINLTVVERLDAAMVTAEFAKIDEFRAAFEFYQDVPVERVSTREYLGLAGSTKRNGDAQPT